MDRELYNAAITPPPAFVPPQHLPGNRPIVEDALAWAAVGFAVLPCDPSPNGPRSKAPLLPKASSPGARDGGLYLASTDPEQIRHWWSKNPEALIAVRTGKVSGTVVIDLDTKAQTAEATFAEIQDFCGSAFDGPITRTQSGGLHLWYRFDGDTRIGNRVNLFKVHNILIGPEYVDVRSDGGYIIVPPSRLRNGRAYSWAVEPDGRLPPLPLRLRDLILGQSEFAPPVMTQRNESSGSAQSSNAAYGGNAKKYAEAALRDEVGLLASTTPGSRGTTLNRAAFVLGTLVGAEALDITDVRSRLMDACRLNGLIDTDGAADVERAVERGLADGAAKPRQLSNVIAFHPPADGPPSVASRDRGPQKRFTGSNREGEEKVCENEPLVSEDSVAIEFVDQNRGKLLYCHSSSRWKIWDGNHWKPDDRRLAFSWCRRTARENAKSQDNKVRVTAGKAAFAAGVERFSQADERFAVTSEFWDRDDFLLGTPGGTVDLRTGDLRPADPREGISRIAAVEPDDRLDCPVWLRFLDEATQGDVGLIRFLQQWSGYNLTGSIQEQSLIFIYGPGGNGKGVFINTITKILGDYSVTAPMTLVMAQRSGQHPTEFAGLAGARMVTAQETEDGRSFSEGRIKTMTGGDKIAARFMRQDFFEYLPQFKLTLVANDQPALRNVDAAMRRRFNIVPFVHAPTQVDHGLEEKLRAEWPSILRWMIEGCLDWQTNGLVRPDCVLNATNDYFTEQDLLAQWVDEKCDAEIGNEYKRDTTANLFESWSLFAALAKDEAGTKKSFSANMQKRGYQPYRTSTERGLVGIRLRMVKDRFSLD